MNGTTCIGSTGSLVVLETATINRIGIVRGVIHIDSSALHTLVVLETATADHDVVSVISLQHTALIRCRIADKQTVLNPAVRVKTRYTTVVTLTIAECQTIPRCTLHVLAVQHYTMAVAVNDGRIRKLPSVRDTVVKRTLRAGDSDGAEEVRKRIADISEQMRKLRHELELADEIEIRSRGTQAAMREIEEQNIEREVKTDEQQFGRSGRTGRTDEPGRG